MDMKRSSQTSKPSPEKVLRSIDDADYYRDPAVISTLSHELKNPLTVISSYSQLLKRRGLTSGDIRAAESAAIILRSSTKLTEMVAAVTDAMKLQAGLLTFFERNVMLEEELRLLVIECNQLYASHEIVLEYERGDDEAEAEALLARRLGEEVPGTRYKVKKPFYVDPDRLRQALKAVIANAIAYSPDAAYILVRMTVSRLRVQISVQDWGVGIPAAALKKVTTAYYRGDDSHPLQKSGLGLGLFIANGILQHFGGTLLITAKDPADVLPQANDMFALPTRAPHTEVTLSLPKRRAQRKKRASHG
jgi:two-component system sensor histidine kinase ArlS